MRRRLARTKSFIYNEPYHDNCHDYLKKIYLELYALPIYKPLLYEIKDKIPKINICNELSYDSYADIIVCDQHAVIFGHYLDICPILATYALNACVALVMYVPQYKVASIAHLDGLPGYSKQSAINDNIPIDFDPVCENIKLILQKLRNLAITKDKMQIEYYLIGGIFHLSEVMVHDIIECINNLEGSEYNFAFRGRNILGPENQTRNICIDSRNGQISYFDYVINSEFYINHTNHNGIPMNIIKAPRKSEAMLDITYEPQFPYFNEAPIAFQ